MDFISYVIDNMSNFGIVSYIFRELGWIIVKLLVYLCNACEKLYKTVFSLIGFFYSSEIMTYIQNKLFPFIVIAFTLSILILAYNLIVKFDDKERKKKLTTFGENFILFVIILFGLPYMFTGKSVWNSQNKIDISNTSYNYSDNNDYLIGTLRGTLLEEDVGNKKAGTLDGGIMSALKWKSSDSTTAEDTVALYLTDYLFMYQKYAKTYAGNNKFVKEVLENSNKNKNQYQNSDGKINALSINSINEDIDQDTVEEILEENYPIKFSEINGVEDTGESNENYVNSLGMNVMTFGIYNWFKDDQEVYALTTKNDDGKTLKVYCEADTDLSEYLFRNSHEESLANGTLMDTPSKINKFFDFLEETPYRYSVEWLPLFLSLFSLILVFFGLSFKTASLIWNLAFNHILVYIFAAGDMAGGQKTREILKSMFSIIMTIIFCFVNLQLYLMGQSYLQNAKFSGAYGSITQSIILLFFAIACVNGPNILIKLFGISGSGLVGAIMAAKGMQAGAKAVKNTVGTAVGVGAGLAGYAKGVKEAKAGSTSALNGGFGNDDDKKESQGDNPFSAGDNKSTNDNEVAQLEEGQSNDNTNNEFGGYVGDGSDKSDKANSETNIGGIDGSEGSNDIDSSETNTSDEKGAVFVTDKDKQLSGYGNKDAKLQDKDLYKNSSIYDQCKELGMSNEEATQTLKDLTSENGKKDDAYDRIGSFVDYDKATESEKKGGLGLSDEKMKQLQEGDKVYGEGHSTRSVGKFCADQMLKKADKEATKHVYNSASPHRFNKANGEVESIPSEFNSRSGAFTGTTNVGNATSTYNNYSNSTIGNSNINSSNTANSSTNGFTGSGNRDVSRMSKAIYGTTVGDVLMPNLSRRYRQGREAGYNSYNNDSASAVLQEEALARNQAMADEIYKNNAVYNVTMSNVIENQANVSQDI